VVALWAAVAQRLSRDHGPGRWTSRVTERGVLRTLETSRLLVVRDGGALVASLRLVARKPWAIDPDYFTQVKKPLYLLDMAVAPSLQRRGIGRRLLAEAEQAARAWPAESIRLDAYDAPAGAGRFYARCGYREVGRVVYRGTPLVYFELVL